MHGFKPGTLVLLTLDAPRQKFIGLLLRLSLAGVEMRGAALDSLEDLTRQIRDGEPPTASTVFFPMRRVERLERDESIAGLPSLAEEFEAKTGYALTAVFRPPTDAEETR